MVAYDELGEALRKQRVLFFALNGLKDAGNLIEDEHVGLFEMAGDIANQLKDIKESLKEEDQLPSGDAEYAELIYKNKDCTVTRRIREGDTITDVVRQVAFLLQGATYSLDLVLKGFADISKEMGA